MPVEPSNTTSAIDPATPDGPLSSGQVRALKIAIVAMGIMIVVGIVVIIGRMFYLAAGGGQQASGSSRTASEGSIALPAGAVIRSMALDGNRLVVHFEAPTGPGLAIMDVASGKLLSRIAVTPEPPRP